MCDACNGTNRLLPAMQRVYYLSSIHEKNKYADPPELTSMLNHVITRTKQLVSMGAIPLEVAEMSIASIIYYLGVEAARGGEHDEVVGNG